MSNLYHGPKVRLLTPKETLGTLESWRNNVLYGLRLNPEFRPYLKEGYQFGKKSRTKPYRDLIDDTKVEKVNEVDVTTVVLAKEDKSVLVDLLLDQVANYAPTVPRNDIVKDSKSLHEVWQKIRLHYNKQQAGSLLNDCWNLKREGDETPQALFARLKQLYDENLLTQEGLYHVDGQVEEDEELSPTLHNTIILHWLQLLHPQLRDMVTQRFITQLRENTYATLFPEISRSVDSLLEELAGEASANRVFHNPRSFPNQFFQPRTSLQGRPPFKPSYQNNSQKKKICDFCRVTGKRAYMTHAIEDCLFIKKMNLGHSSSATAKTLDCDDTDHDDLRQQYEDFYSHTSDDQEHQTCLIEHVISRVSMDASPVLTLSKDNEPYDLTLDSGATCNVVSKNKAVKMKANIRATNQRVRMADGTNLPVVGETDIVLYRNNQPFYLSAIVCNRMETDILAGMSFMKINDVAIRPATDEIILNGKEFIKYDPVRKTQSRASRVTNYIVQSEKHQVLMPGESVDFNLAGFSGNVAVEPRWDAQCNKTASKDSLMWPKPQVVTITNGKVSLSNPLSEPVIIKKLDHICQVKPEVVMNSDQSKPDSDQLHTYTIPPLSRRKKQLEYSSHVSLNPDNLLSKEEEESIRNILTTYDIVFDPAISVYNGKSGPCHVEVNLGDNLPPQRKGRVPFYGRENLMELQNKFDELLATGILSRPLEVGVTVENTNPSFLVRKQPPSTDKRLVTDFTSIAEFCRPTPSLMPDVESILRSVGSWKYLVKTDMSSAYHQIPMKKSSMKYCGVHTPYRGLLVYNVGCMGLPGVEVALEELTCLILGEMVKEGKVAKIADDLFIGGNSPDELKDNLQEVLHKLHENNIKLKAVKTVVAPKEVTILGWIWSAGKLKASPHRLLALSTCQRPETIKAMRSYLGAYRFISRVLRGYAKLLSPLEKAIQGKESKEKVAWSDDLVESFKKTQHALTEAKTVTIPRATDTLCIITDASVRPGALGATLYVVRQNERLLAGFYNCKLPDFQSRWLPCELEGLGIAAALNHFAPYIIQSETKPQVLTDSKPCVQAVQKLMRGEFSASARLSTFLSTVSRYQARVQHIPGTSNIPSDYASRHPLECKSDKCSVCKFVCDTMQSVIQQISVEDVIEGRSAIPYTNRNTWRAVQEECRDLRKVKSFRQQGTTPSKKSRNLRQVRRYLSAGVILAHDGVLVQPYSAPLRSIVERVVVPEQVLHGILTVLHLKLNHPTAHQLVKAFTLYFYSLNLEKAVSEVSNSCHQCASIKDIPRAMIEQTTDNPPTSVGAKFAADVVKRCGQKILVTRESVSSYTLAELIPDETAKSISESLVKQCNILRPLSLRNITIRVDPAPAHQSLFKSISNENILTKNNICLQLGRTLNKNKNPVIDKGIREIHRELLILNPSGGPITSSTLSQAIANLNSRYRKSGLSAQEMWTQRDQVNGEQLPIKDRDLIIEQSKSREENHPYSQRSKAFGKPYRQKADVKVGSLVYIYTDRDKTVARPRYLVTSISDGWCKLRRFSATLFGTQEYDAKLEECYRVPHLDEVTLPQRDDVGSSDSDEYSSDEKVNKFPSKKSPRRLTSDEEESRIESSDEEDLPGPRESDEDLSSDNNGTVLQEPAVIPARRQLQDPDFVPPRNTNTAPATMERQPRERKPPDRFGAWSS